MFTIELHLKFRHEVLNAFVYQVHEVTKNAGFACFGSVSELLSDLKTHSEEEVFHYHFTYKTV